MQNDQMLFLDRNELTAGPSPACLEILRSISVEELSCYTRAFRKGTKGPLSERLSALHGVREESILLGYGAEDLLKQVVHCCLKRNGVLLKPELSWWYYDSVASEVGGNTLTFPLIRGWETFDYDVRAIIEGVQKTKPDILLISSPNNPTGNSLPSSDLLKVLEAAKKTTVVVDQAYAGFTESTGMEESDLLQRFPRLMFLRTFSKLYGLAGARIGYALVGEGLESLVRFNQRYLGFHRISELLAIAALDSGEYYRTLKSIVARERKKYYQLHRHIPELRVYRSDANFVLVSFPPAWGERIRSFLARNNIVVKFFDDDDTRLQNHIRITIGTPEQNALVLKTLMGIPRQQEVAAA